MPTYIDQPLVVGDSVPFGLAVKRNSLAWDITGATVTFRHRDPSGNWSAELAASVTDGPDGEAIYDAGITVLDEGGLWLRVWKVVDAAGVVKLTQQIEFEVLPGPG